MCDTLINIAYVQPLLQSTLILQSPYAMHNVSGVRKLHDLENIQEA